MWWAISNDGDRPIGTITLEVDGDAGQIHWLMVDPAARRSGVASALLQALENAAWDAGVRQLSAETLSTWAPAVAFYRRHGYQAPPIADRAKSR
ncbi:putative N-acetyltransferase YjcF [Blastopirellula retiformator]|uniref:Putative N-acetyltransferase YjcF n=2 Tax=Blastopirellula retiformator TaxID=2527970 RepID=A0A5C5UWS2_9BACT|nr:putative N-acetyltransferase YjcF [Blastopirellula retiformator]